MMLEQLDVRIVLTGEAFQPFPNDDPVVNPPAESLLPLHPEVNRTVFTMFPNNDLTRNHKLLRDRKPERIPALATATFELGEMQGNDSYVPYDYYYVLPFTPGTEYEGPGGIMHAAKPTGPKGFFPLEGPSAGSYDPEERFFDIADVASYLPTVPSWGQSNSLHSFLPANPGNFNTTTNDNDNFTLNPDPNTSIQYSLQTTLTVQMTYTPSSPGTPGQWTYQETLTTTYDVWTYYTTSTVVDTRHQSGTYDYQFIQNGTFVDWGVESTFSYEVHTAGDDAFSIDFDQTYSYTVGSTIVETGLYTFVASGTRDVEDHVVYNLSLANNQYTGTYTENGQLAISASFSSVGSEYDYQRNEGNLLAGNGLASHEVGDLSEVEWRTVSSTYTGSGSVSGDYTLVRTGQRIKDGIGLRGYDVLFEGTYDFDEQTTDSSSSTSKQRHDTWREVIDDSWGTDYTDTINYLANNTQTVNTVEEGTAIGLYDTRGTHTLATNNSWTSGGINHMDAYSWASTDGMTPPPIGSPYTAKYTYHYLKNIDKNVSSGGTETIVGGTLDEEGTGEFFKNTALSMSYTVTETRNLTDRNITKNQSNAIVEQLVDNYFLDYDDSTTYASDGSRTTHVLEDGEGDSDWDFDRDDAYSWTSNATDSTWTTTYSQSAGSTPIRYTNDMYYDYHVDTVTTRNSANAITARTGMISTSNYGSGTRDIDNYSNYDYSYSHNGTTKDLTSTTNWGNNDNYAYSNANQATYYSDGSVEYDVAESGTGVGSRDYDNTYIVDYGVTSSSQYGSSTHTIDDRIYYMDDEQYAYNYSSTFATDVAPNGTVTINATIVDAGTSNGQFDYERDGSDYSSSYYNDGYSSSSSMDRLTWDVDADSIYGHTVDYTTTITPDPDPYGYGYIVTVAGNGEVTNRSGSWSVTEIRDWAYSYSDPEYSWSDSGSDTQTWGDTWSNQSTFFNNEYDGPRAGRTRVYGWNLPLLRILVHGRFKENWDAVAKPPV